MKKVRMDKKVETAVNRGLAAALLGDVAAGVRVMAQEGVPADVMTRVFLAPQSRRASDWKH